MFWKFLVEITVSQCLAITSWMPYKTRLWTGGGVKSHCLELKNEDRKSSTQTLQSTCMSGSFGNYIPSLSITKIKKKTENISLFSIPYALQASSVDRVNF